MRCVDTDFLIGVLGADPRAAAILSRFHILEMDHKAAQAAAAVYAGCRSKGEEVPMRDAMIAGIAKVHGCSLITGDTDHFGRVPGLKVIKIRITSRERPVSPFRILSIFRH